MPADPARLPFFVDESLLGLGKILAIARPDVVHTGHPLIPQVPLGALDTDWMPLVARRRLAVIARDKRIRTKPAELRILRDEGMRVFWIADRRDMDNWGYLTRIVRRWDEIDRAVSDGGAGPWFREIREHGVVPVVLRTPRP